MKGEQQKRHCEADLQELAVDWDLGEREPVRENV